MKCNIHSIRKVDILKRSKKMRSCKRVKKKKASLLLTLTSQWNKHTETHQKCIREISPNLKTDNS